MWPVLSPDRTGLSRRIVALAVRVHPYSSSSLLSMSCELPHGRKLSGVLVTSVKNTAIEQGFINGEIRHGKGSHGTVPNGPNPFKMGPFG